MCVLYGLSTADRIAGTFEKAGASTAHPISGPGFELVMGPAVVRLQCQWLSFSAGLL